MAWWSVLPGSSGQGGDTTPLPDLAAVARELLDGDDPFFGRVPLAELEAQKQLLARGDHLRRVDLDLKLFAHHLRMGDVQAAIHDVEEALVEARALPALQPIRHRLHYWRGLAWLRQAELTNCIQNHVGTCCVWPFEGQGLHRVAEPAERALSSFLQYLELRPDDLGVRWLAHVSAAAASRPQAVPARFRIDTESKKAAENDHRVPRFVDRAPELGVDAFDLSGGALVVDVDGDGFLDLVSTSSHPLAPMRLYRSRGDGSFEDRSVASGLVRQVGGLHCLAADHDNDGDLDLLVLRGAWLMDRGQIRNSLLQNDGNGNFTDVTQAAGLAWPARPTQTAVFADFDQDGHLDLYIGNESRREIGPHPGGDFPSQMFKNNGDGTFTDLAVQAGVTNDRYAKGVCVGDYDDDGDLDLYVSNVGRNRLYRNDGGFRFTDVAEQLGVVEPGGRSFACWFFDYDNDGRLDLFVAPYAATLSEVAGDLIRQAGQKAPTSGEIPRLYRNLGGRFKDVTRAVGLDRVCLPMGANFGDVDGDGFLDIYLGTGEPGYEALVPNLLFRNDNGRCFVDATGAAGLGHLQKGHGVAFADLDHDGDEDLFHQIGGFYPGDRYYNALFENTGGPSRFLSVELVARSSHQGAVGARLTVEIETSDGPRVLHRAIGSVSSYGGSPLRQYLGLREATAVTSLTVHWPGGRCDRHAGLEMDQFLRIVEGEDVPEILVRPRFPLHGNGR